MLRWKCELSRERVIILKRECAFIIKISILVIKNVSVNVCHVWSEWRILALWFLSIGREQKRKRTSRLYLLTFQVSFPFLKPLYFLDRKPPDKYVRASKSVLRKSIIDPFCWMNLGFRHFGSFLTLERNSPFFKSAWNEQGTNRTPRLLPSINARNTLTLRLQTKRVCRSKWERCGVWRRNLAV